MNNPNIGVLQCCLCPRLFTSAAAYKNHLAKQHKKKSEDDTRAGSEKQLRSHECSECGETFEFKKTYNNHMESAHNLDVRQSFSCEHCNKTFKTKTGKQFHEIRHRGEKPYKCSHCDLAFDNPGSKSAHIRREHKPSHLYKCKKCRRTLATSPKIPSDNTAM